MTDLRLLCDLPTQSGIDPDHPSAWNSMMCGGVATYALPVYEKMLAGLPLGEAVFELAHAGMSSFLYFYGLLVAMMENRGLDIRKLRGNSINDPIRTKLVYGCPDFPTKVDRRICLDHIEFSVRNTPNWRPIAPNGVDPCQGGMDAVRELGGCLAVATVVMEDLRERGITIDEYGPMVFSLDAESDFFETIAKFRLARKMWAKIAREKLGATTDRAMQLKIGIRTSGLSLTHQKPLNNAARVTLQILSCVLGGVNSLDASSIDEAVGLPSQEARIFNLDAQHIITHEANVPLVADPLGGSYYLEWLTSQDGTGSERIPRGNRGAGRHLRLPRIGMAQRRHGVLPRRGAVREGRRREADRRGQRLPLRGRGRGPDQRGHPGHRLQGAYGGACARSVCVR